MERIIFILELIGVFAFSVSGAMAALDKNADIFGVIVLSITTALGGGVIRDILLGQLPPKMFVSYAYLLTAALASVAVFADAYVRKEKYVRNKDKLDAVNNLFDALGLAVFTVSGMNTAITCTGADNALLVILLGMVTGIGGGMLRDVMTNTMPQVLRKRVYAVASLAGAVVYYLLFRLNVNGLIAACAGMVSIFALRVLATVFKWNLPKAELNS